MMLMSDPNFTIRQITFDCNDPSKLAEFWSAATGCEIAADYGDFVMVDSTPALGFQRVKDPTPGKTACTSTLAGRSAKLLSNASKT